jgi:molybdenum cofactor cytidylyltransferase
MAEGNADYVACIVLALGLPTSSGQDRMLEVIGERTNIGHVVYECLTSKARQVIVVAGPEPEKIATSLKDFKCDVVFDEDYLKGQSYSIKKGLTRLNEGVDAVMLVPGDIALVDRTRINTLIRKYSTCYAPIVSKGYHGKSLRPILFDKNLIGELRTISEDTDGINSLVSKYGSQRQFVKISEAALLRRANRRDRLKARLGLSKRSTS